MAHATCEGSGGGHHYASLFVSLRGGQGGLDLALMELSDIPHDEVLAEGSTRPQAEATAGLGRRATRYHRLVLDLSR
jgi:hypothetical protein